MEVNKLDKVNIYASCNLSNDDYYSMSLLYQPLIGCQAVGIFLTFSSLLERNNLKSENFFHSNLFDILNISNEDFIKERLKLEAIGLLETYLKDGELVYLLKQPLTPNQFLKDSTFGLYLYSKIGKVMYENLINHFKIDVIDKEQYENITVNFDEVFSSEVPDLETIDSKDLMLGRKPNNSIVIKHHEFDFESFLEVIDENYLEHGVTPAFRKTIVDTSYNYGFDEGDMASIYKQSLGKDGYFDVRAMKKKCHILFKVKTSADAPTLSVKEPVNQELLDTLCNVSIPALLDHHWPNYPKSYLMTVEQIFENIDLPREVITIMIYSVLKQKDGELPGLPYFKTVAKQWESSGIDTKETAFHHITNRTKAKPTIEKPKKTYAKKEPKVKTTDWADEYVKNIEEGFETL